MVYVNELCDGTCGHSELCDGTWAGHSELCDLGSLQRVEMASHPTMSLSKSQKTFKKRVGRLLRHSEFRFHGESSHGDTHHIVLAIVPGGENLVSSELVDCGHMRDDQLFDCERLPHVVSAEAVRAGPTAVTVFLVKVPFTGL